MFERSKRSLVLPIVNHHKTFTSSPNINPLLLKKTKKEKKKPNKCDLKCIKSVLAVVYQDPCLVDLKWARHHENTKLALKNKQGK